MKKRLISIALSFVMTTSILGMIPSKTMIVNAEEFCTEEVQTEECCDDSVTDEATDAAKSGEIDTENDFVTTSDTSFVKKDNSEKKSCAGHKSTEAESDSDLASSDYIEATPENFPDPGFRRFVKECMVGYTYGYIDYINIYSGYNVKSLKGIELFPNLNELIVNENSSLTSVDLSKNTKITHLDLMENGLTSLDVSKLLELNYLEISFNKIKSIDLSKNYELSTFYCFATNITTIDVSQCADIVNTDMLCYIDTLYINDTVKNINIRKNQDLKYNYKCYASSGVTIKTANSSILDIANGFSSNEGTSYVTGIGVGNTTISYYFNGKNYLTQKVYVKSVNVDAFEISSVNLSPGTSYSSHKRYINGDVVIRARDNTRKNLQARVIYKKDGSDNWGQSLDWSSVSTYKALTSFSSIELPVEYGKYIIVVEVKNTKNGEVKQYWTEYEHHPYLDGTCQMPYTGQGGGYLIGVKVNNYTPAKYTCKMLILDCNKYMQGLPAWIYETEYCGFVDRGMWTVWQPIPGYYWTLFRIYDENKNIVDEVCYGFVNM